MQRFDTPVRSPTGNAWILAVMPFVLGGELLWEALKPEVATFFRIPFTDGELAVGIIASGLLSVVGFVWVASLYVSPGKLTIDFALGLVRRERRPGIRQQVIEAPLSQWQVRIQFFSETYRTKGAFRRLELKGPELQEVLLLADVPDGKALVTAFEAVKDQLGNFIIDIKRPTSGEPSAP